MFDDHQIPPPGGNVPENLPFGNVDDMFAPIKEETPPAAPSALGAGILRPATPKEPPKESLETLERPIMATMPQAVQEQYTIKEPRLSRGIMTTIIILVVLLVMGAVGWFIYGLFLVPPVISPEPDKAPEEEEPAPEASAEVSDEELLDDRILFGEPIDSDGDGLIDDEEQVRGTDFNNWDSDGDDLRDGDEVLIWKTDPLNPDTDGDTYLDGQEVKSGYNPNGPGRFTQQAALQASTTEIQL